MLQGSCDRDCDVSLGSHRMGQGGFGWKDAVSQRTS